MIGLVVVGAWLVASAGNAKQTEPMAGGAVHVSQVMIEGRKVNLNLVCFDSAKHQMLVVSNPRPGRDLRIAGYAKAHSAVAACNGGYFVPKDMSPYGLEVAEGVSTGTFLNTGERSAVFVIRSDKPFIEYEKDFKPSPEVTGLVQCGPMLVNKDWMFQEPGSSSTARTFVMTDGNGKWVIGVADSLTLTELATLLARPNFVDGFKVQTAMNLDGGPSTGFWWQDKEGHEHNEPEHWRVRNVLVVKPR